MSVIDFEFVNEKPFHVKVSIDGVEHTEITYVGDWNYQNYYGRMKKLAEFHWRLKIPKDKFRIDHGMLIFSKKDEGIIYIDENTSM